MNNNKGFTLIEIIVAMAFAGIVMTMIYSFFLYNHKLYTASDRQITITGDINAILDVVSEIAREASTIVEVGNGEYDFMFDEGLGTPATKIGKVIYNDDDKSLTIEGKSDYTNINSFIIKSSDEDIFLADAEKVIIQIEGEIGNEHQSLEIQVSLRNKIDER